MDGLIPCAGSLMFVFLVLGFIVVMRYMSYQETLKLAEKGLVKPMRQNGEGKGALIWGILIAAVGFALTIGIWPLDFLLHTNMPFGFGPWMLTGLLPMFFGIGLILVYVLTRESKPKDESSEQPDKPKE